MNRPSQITNTILLRIIGIESIASSFESIRKNKIYSIVVCWNRNISEIGIMNSKNNWEELKKIRHPNKPLERRKIHWDGLKYSLQSRRWISILVKKRTKYLSIDLFMCNPTWPPTSSRRFYPSDAPRNQPLLRLSKPQISLSSYPEEETNQPFPWLSQTPPPFPSFDLGFLVSISLHNSLRASQSRFSHSAPTTLSLYSLSRGKSKTQPPISPPLAVWLPRKCLYAIYPQLNFSAKVNELPLEFS